MNEQLPFENQPIQQGVEHGPHKSSYKFDSRHNQFAGHAVMAHEALSDGHISQEQHDALQANLDSHRLENDLKDIEENVAKAPALFEHRQESDRKKAEEREQERIRRARLGRLGLK